MLPKLYSQNLPYHVNGSHELLAITCIIATAIYTLTPSHRAPCSSPLQFAYATDTSTIGRGHLQSRFQIKIDKNSYKMENMLTVEMAATNFSIKTQLKAFLPNWRRFSRTLLKCELISVGRDGTRC